MLAAACRSRDREKYIAGIKAIDNPRHPMLSCAAGAKRTAIRRLPLDAIP